MRTAALLLVLVLVAGLAWAQSVSFSDQKATTHSILLRSEKDHRQGAVCSATAVSPDTFRTARHCVDRYALVAIDGHPAEVYGTRMLKGDAAEVVLTRELFTHWARLGQSPRQGDHLHWWGNPMPVQGHVLLLDMYREGVVAGASEYGVVIDATVCHGDSGSGLFNDAGELVGIVVAKLPEAPCSFAIGQL